MKFSRESLALCNLSFAVRDSQVFCIVGPNGAGKTTTLKIILGLLTPTAGCVCIHGHDLAQEAIQARALTAYVPEQVALYGEMTALENLEYFLRLSGRTDLRQSTCCEFLQQVGFPEKANHRYLKHLSKGLRQKVALAVAVGRNARVLILDEPMSGLDPRSIHELISVLHKQRTNGNSVLMVSHDLSSVCQIADVIGFMHSGRLVAEIKRQELGTNSLSRLHELYDRLLTDISIYEGA
jgi:ABC-2 type transport system ATP-binding protein